MWLIEPAKNLKKYNIKKNETILIISLIILVKK